VSPISLKAFANSVAALERALQLYEAHRGGELRVMARNSVILEFEICYGQCRPALQRCLEEFDGTPSQSLDEMSYASLIRTANERGYSETPWAEWKAFRDARNTTAHAYSEPAAEEILLQIPKFLITARDMLSRMMRKQAER